MYMFEEVVQHLERGQFQQKNLSLRSHITFEGPARMPPVGNFDLFYR